MCAASRYPTYIPKVSRIIPKTERSLGFIDGEASSGTEFRCGLRALLTKIPRKLFEDRDLRGPSLSMGHGCHQDVHCRPICTESRTGQCGPRRFCKMQTLGAKDSA